MFPIAANVDVMI